MNDTQAFCPQCKKDVTFASTFEDKTCPECGFKFRQAEPPSVTAPRRIRGGWLIFFMMLIAPAFLTFAVMATASSPDSGVAVTFIGSGVSALVCGVWLALRVSEKLALRIVLGLLLVPAFYAACFALCFVGCAAASKIHPMRW